MGGVSTPHSNPSRELDRRSGEGAHVDQPLLVLYRDESIANTQYGTGLETLDHLFFRLARSGGCLR